jgi:hypothetical protein
MSLRRKRRGEEKRRGFRIFDTCIMLEKALRTKKHEGLGSNISSDYL